MGPACWWSDTLAGRTQRELEGRDGHCYTPGKPQIARHPEKQEATGPSQPQVGPAHGRRDPSHRPPGRDTVCGSSGWSVAWGGVAQGAQTRALRSPLSRCSASKRHCPQAPHLLPTKKMTDAGGWVLGAVAVGVGEPALGLPRRLLPPPPAAPLLPWGRGQLRVPGGSGPRASVWRPPPATARLSPPWGPGGPSQGLQVAVSTKEQSHSCGDRNHSTVPPQATPGAQATVPEGEPGLCV